MVNKGVTFIDTADSYGPGISGTLIAKALYPYLAGLVVATKGGLTRPGADRWVADCRPEHLRRACADSPRRLRPERIELYQLHAVDHRIPIEDSVGTLIDRWGCRAENPRFCRSHPPYRATALAIARSLARRKHIGGAGNGAGSGAERPANDRPDGTAGCVAARGPGCLPGNRAGYRVRIPRRPDRLADVVTIRIARRTGVSRHRRA